MAEPIEISDYNGSAMSWDVAGMLRYCVKQIENGKSNPTKAVVIFLNDEQEAWEVSHAQSQMSYADVLALLTFTNNLISMEMME